MDFSGIKAIVQSANYTCGFACIRTLLNWHNLWGDIKKQTPILQKFNSFNDLEDFLIQILEKELGKKKSEFQIPIAKKLEYLKEMALKIALLFYIYEHSYEGEVPDIKTIQELDKAYDKTEAYIRRDKFLFPLAIKTILSLFGLNRDDHENNLPTKTYSLTGAHLLDLPAEEKNNKIIENIEKATKDNDVKGILLFLDNEHWVVFKQLLKEKKRKEVFFKIIIADPWTGGNEIILPNQVNAIQAYTFTVFDKNKPSENTKFWEELIKELNKPLPVQEEIIPQLQEQAASLNWEFWKLFVNLYHLGLINHPLYIEKTGSFLKDIKCLIYTKEIITNIRSVAQKDRELNNLVKDFNRMLEITDAYINYVKENKDTPGFETEEITGAFFADFSMDATQILYGDSLNKLKFGIYNSMISIIEKLTKKRNIDLFEYGINILEEGKGKAFTTYLNKFREQIEVANKNVPERDRIFFDNKEIMELIDPVKGIPSIRLQKESQEEDPVKTFSKAISAIKQIGVSGKEVRVCVLDNQKIEYFIKALSPPENKFEHSKAEYIELCWEILQYFKTGFEKIEEEETLYSFLIPYNLIAQKILNGPKDFYRTPKNLTELIPIINKTIIKKTIELSPLKKEIEKKVQEITKIKPILAELNNFILASKEGVWNNAEFISTIKEVLKPEVQNESEFTPSEYYIIRLEYLFKKIRLIFKINAQHTKLFSTSLKLYKLLLQKIKNNEDYYKTTGFDFNLIIDAANTAINVEEKWKKLLDSDSKLILKEISAGISTEAPAEDVLNNFLRLTDLIIGSTEATVLQLVQSDFLPDYTNCLSKEDGLFKPKSKYLDRVSELLDELNKMITNIKDVQTIQAFIDVFVPLELKIRKNLSFYKNYEGISNNIVHKLLTKTEKLIIYLNPHSLELLKNIKIFALRSKLAEYTRAVGADQDFNLKEYKDLISNDEKEFYPEEDYKEQIIGFVSRIRKHLFHKIANNNYRMTILLKVYYPIKVKIEENTDFYYSGAQGKELQNLISPIKQMILLLVTELSLLKKFRTDEEIINILEYLLPKGVNQMRTVTTGSDDDYNVDFTPDDDYDEITPSMSKQEKLLNLFGILFGYKVIQSFKTPYSLDTNKFWKRFYENNKDSPLLKDFIKSLLKNAQKITKVLIPLLEKMEKNNIKPVIYTKDEHGYNLSLRHVGGRIIKFTLEDITKINNFCEVLLNKREVMVDTYIKALYQTSGEYTNTHIHIYNLHVDDSENFFRWMAFVLFRITHSLEPIKILGAGSENLLAKQSIDIELARKAVNDLIKEKKNRKEKLEEKIGTKK